MSLENVSVLCFLASYLVTFALELTRLLKRSTISRSVMLVFGTAGLVAHTAYLLSRSAQKGLPPLLGSSHDWLLVLAWIAILCYLFLTTFDRELAVGLFLLPLVLLLIAATYFVNSETITSVGEPGQHRALVKSWAMLHSSLLIFGIAGVLIGLVLGLMYVVQHRRLKHKQPLHDGLSLPSLAKLSRWNWWSVMISIPLLTLGMATGVWLTFLSQDRPNAIVFTDPVILAYGVVWLMMAAFFVWMWIYRARHPAGKQLAWLTIWAFAFLLVTFIGLQILTGGSLHSWHA